MTAENNELQEILEEFFTEADESLDELERDLIKLETMAESGDNDPDLVDRLFRVLHTLKGGAGFLGLEHMSKLAHAGENLLDEVRSGKVAVDKNVMDALLQTNDQLKELLELSKNGDDPTSLDNTDLIAELEKLTAGGATAPAAEAPAAEVPTADTPVAEVPQAEVPAAAPPAQADETPSVAAPAEDPAPPPAQDIDLSNVVNPDLLDEIASDPLLAPERDVEAEQAPPPAAEAPDEPAPQSGSMSINTDLLDEINNDPRLTGPAVDISALNQPGAAPAMDDAAASPAEASDEMPQPAAEDAPADETAADEPDYEVAAPAVAEEASAPTETTPMAETEVILKRGEAAPMERREKVEDRRDKPTDRRKASRRTGDAETSIRVETGKLDKTMNLVGELVLARNSLVRQLENADVQRSLRDLENYPAISSNMELLWRVTQDLQMSVLSTRMQPIKRVFDKIPRQVRELKNKLGRDVDLIIDGEMTEVDKTLVEELSDPMVHLIRNALDHGIETPDVRRQSGKNPTGTLSIRAYYEGNKVVIQIADDGKGMDPDVLKNIAISRGVIDEATAASMPDNDAYRLIFAPGFSTAKEVSDVSGRGVGMDVVNSAIEKVKGTVDVTSELGIGTTVSIYLPLTLAIVQALVVETNQEGFAIPIGDISEVIKFKPEDIHKVNDQDVIELRGDVLPLFYLYNLTKHGRPMEPETYRVPSKPAEVPAVASPVPADVPAAAPLQEAVMPANLAPVGTAQSDAAAVVTGPASPLPGTNGHAAPAAPQAATAAPAAVTGVAAPQQAREEADRGYVVVVREGTSAMGVVTDRLIGQEEAVIKPVTNLFDFNSAISGATITGDGTVHMILDVPFLIKDITRRDFQKRKA